MIFCDSHFHLSECNLVSDGCSDDRLFGISCSLDENQFNLSARKIIEEKKDGNEILNAFGIFPLNSDDEKIESLYEYLELLCRDRKICAVGEMGFDLYEKKTLDNIQKQDKLWEKQLKLAVEFQMPLIIHNRKAFDLMIKDYKMLQKIPSVIMHNFSFGVNEAEFMLKKEINAYFSFGTQLINGNRRNLSCLEELPVQRILLETDSPYHPVKDDDGTILYRIKKVYEKASEIKKVKLPELCMILLENNQRIFKEFQELP